MNNVQSLTPPELKSRLDGGASLVLLDVREPDEIAIACIDGSISIPLGELGQRHRELDPERPIVCICHHGIRSAHAAQALTRLAFSEVYNLSGGIDRWACEVEPSMKRYR